jgi:hypothetical protein
MAHCIVLVDAVVVTCYGGDVTFFQEKSRPKGVRLVDGLFYTTDAYLVFVKLNKFEGIHFELLCWRRILVSQ